MNNQTIKDRNKSGMNKEAIEFEFHKPHRVTTKHAKKKSVHVFIYGFSLSQTKIPQGIERET